MQAASERAAAAGGAVVLLKNQPAHRKVKHMLNMLAEITKISPSIPLIVALIASAVGFGVQCVLCWKTNAFIIKLIPFFVYLVLFACLLEVFINPFGWHSEWDKLSALAAGIYVLVGLSGVLAAWCVFGFSRPNRKCINYNE